MRAILVVVAMAGCANVNVNRAALVASTAALACDWAQTRAMASGGWAGGYTEANPMMGATPGTGTVDAYFATAAVVNAALWYVIPDRYRAALPLAVVGLQSTVIAGNLRDGTNACGIGSSPTPHTWTRSWH